MRNVDKNSWGLQWGPVRGAESGGGEHQGTTAQCAPVKFLAERKEEIYLGKAWWDRQTAFIMSPIVCKPFLFCLYSKIPPASVSACIVDVLSSHFCFGAPLSVLTYTLITCSSRKTCLVLLPCYILSCCDCVNANDSVDQPKDEYVSSRNIEGQAGNLCLDWTVKTGGS